MRRLTNKAIPGEIMVLAVVLTMALALFAAPAFAQTTTKGASESGSRPIKLVVLGDSLSAGLGLAASAAFPARLAPALKARGIDVDILNAGVSGDTSSGGRDRLDWSIPEGTEAVIVELGANDALRGLDPSVTRAALDDILTKLKARGIAVLLSGMYAPPNFGADYTAKFNAIYPELAKKHDVPLYEFFLDGVAGNAALNQPDGIHPTAAGVDEIVKRILPQVEAFLRPLRAASAAR